MNEPLIAPVERHSPREIAARVAEVARSLEARLGSDPLLVVGVLKGSAIFLADLVRAIRLPTRFEFIDVSRTDEADGESEPLIAIRFFRHFPIENQHVLVLKDVVTTGVVENYLLSQLRAQQPKSLALACVIDRPPARRVSLDVDHSLFHEPEERRWVGYGLDNADGSYAHLAALAILPSPPEGADPSRR
jgi:hypoxanthine phosphoribosyltransferase